MGKPDRRPMARLSELSALCKDGTELPVEISLSPIASERGSEVLASVRDVREQQAARRKVAHYAKQLERSNAELQDFAYVASHDLKSPLNSIIGFSKLLQKRIGGSLDENSAELFSYILQGGRRMSALIDDLLALSQVSGGEIKKEVVDFDEVLNAVQQDLSALLNDSGGALDWKGLPSIEADRGMMTQLLQNLVGNALKFCRQGIAPHITVTGTLVENMCHLQVSDNGIGVEEKRLADIFRVFTRLHNADDYPGNGIGLALCHKIVVTRHGGAIWMTSKPGEGATVHIELPQKQPVLTDSTADAG